MKNAVYLLILISAFAKGQYVMGGFNHAAGPCGAIGTPCTDIFPGSSLSGNWTVSQGSFTTASNEARALTTNGSSGYANAFYSGQTFTPTQFAQVSQTNSAGNAVSGLIVEATSTGSYFLQCNTSATALDVYRLVYPATFTHIGGTGTCNVGGGVTNILRMEATVSGTTTTIVVKVNGTVATGVGGADSSGALLTGSPGIIINTPYSGLTQGLKTWSGGNL